MNGKERDPGQDMAQPLQCADCREGLQEYLDGTMEKQLSLRFFLHLRECDPCREQHEAMKGLFAMLDSLPGLAVPADFDDAILASVPYAAYREMEPLRRERVPVYLAEHFLPRFVRSRVTRLVGLGISAASLSGVLAGSGPTWLPLVAVAGLLPELLVRLQGVGRRVVSHGRAEG